MTARYLSLSAIAWAHQQRTGNATANHLLIVMAGLVADKPMKSDEGCTWPPMHCWARSETLAEATQQDPKTVAANLKKLVMGGYIELAGRQGETGRRPVYQLSVNQPENGVIAGRVINPFFPGNLPKNGVSPIKAFIEGRVKEGSTPSGSYASRKKTRTAADQGVTIAEWIARTKAAGEWLIPDDHPVLAYADDVGIPGEWLRIAWTAFVHRFTYGKPNERRNDWRAYFDQHVRGDFLKLWMWTDNGRGGWKLTAAGFQAREADAAIQRRTTEATAPTDQPPVPLTAEQHQAAADAAAPPRTPLTAEQQASYAATMKRLAKRHNWPVVEGVAHAQP